MRLGKLRLIVASAAIALVAAACGGQAPGGPGGGGGGGGGISVGMALDVGGLGDKSFNDAANRGLQQAIQEGLVTQENVELLQANQTGSNREENVTNLADQGYDLVIAVGFAFSEHIAAIAPDYPDVDFAVVDGFANAVAEDLTNVADLTFKEHEGSYLVGVAAGMKTQTTTVGFLGGQEGTGLIEKFQAGYEAGVQSVCPDCEILVEYIGDSTQAFVDPTRGEALSASMLKRVDTAVFDAIQQVVDGAFESGFQVFGLAEEGVDYADSNPELSDEIRAEMDAAKEAIIAGEITVPEEPQG